MSLDNKLVSLASLKISHDYLDARIDATNSVTGDLSDLQTSANSDLVAAINEAAQSGGTQVEIDTTLTVAGEAADAKATGDALATKVDAETGKGLSTNDYTTAEKTKLAGIEAEANKTTVDSALSSSSTNPVQNSVVKAAIDSEASARQQADDTLTASYNTLSSQITGLTGGVTGAASVETMTDTSKIYVNTTDGYWYYYDDTNSVWVQGGVYQSAAADSAMSDSSTNAVQNSVVKAYVDGEVSSINAHIGDVDTALGITSTDSTACDYTSETYSAGIIVGYLNVMSTVPLTDCTIKTLTLAMNTNRPLECTVYVVKSDLSAVVWSQSYSGGSSATSHTVDIDYTCDSDTYYIGIYTETTRAVTFGPANTDTQTNCYVFDAENLTIGELYKADKRRIRGAIVITTVGECRIDTLEDDMTDMGTRVTALETELSDDLPSYYADYISGKITSLLALDAATQGDSFVFVTDYHMESNAGNSPALIQKITEQTATKMIVFGGDAINQYDTKVLAFPKFPAFHALWDFSKSYYPIIGNHEYNDPGNQDTGYTGKRMTNSEAYGMNLRQKEVDSRYVWDGGYCYHVDNTAQKIRYYMLGCNVTATIEAESRNAFLTSLESVPSGYAVVVIAHALASYNSGNPVYGGAGQVIADGCDAYNARESYTANSLSHDYSSATGEVILLLQGHTHIDFDLTTTGGIHTVCTTCDAMQESSASSLTRTTGTTTEQAFDVVHIDTTDRTIKLTRIGAGSDRTFSY